jgi:hypothetical protein
MSFFKLGMDKVQEALTLALMLIFIIVVLYLNIDIAYKIGIGALTFGVIFLTGLANQALKQQKEESQKNAK